MLRSTLTRGSHHCTRVPIGKARLYNRQLKRNSLASEASIVMEGLQATSPMPSLTRGEIETVLYQIKTKGSHRFNLTPKKSDYSGVTSFFGYFTGAAASSTASSQNTLSTDSAAFSDSSLDSASTSALLNYPEDSFASTQTNHEDIISALSTTSSTTSNSIHGIPGFGSLNPQMSSLFDGYGYVSGIADPRLIKPIPSPPPDWIVNTFPIDTAQDFIVWVHSATGLPWYLSLAVAALCVRALIIPLSYIQLRMVAKFSRLSVSLSHLRMIYQGLVSIPQNKVIDKMSPMEAVSACWGIIRKLSNAQGIKFSVFFLPMVFSIPLFITFNSACRQLMHGAATSKIAETLAVEGPFWCPDLTQPDPELFLPLIAFTATAANIHYLFRRFTPPESKKDKKDDKANSSSGSSGSSSGGTSTEKKPHREGAIARRVAKLPLLLQLLAAGVLPFTLNLPASLFIYWTCAMSFSILQSAIVRSKFMRELAGFNKPKLPLTSVELPFVKREEEPRSTVIPSMDKKFVQAVLADTKREKELKEL